MGVGEFQSWHPHDRDAAIAYRSYSDECCPECGTHPSVVKPDLGGDRNAVIPEWRYCRVCDLIGQASDEGPPQGEGQTGHGWRLILQRHDHDNDREAT